MPPSRPQIRFAGIVLGLLAMAACSGGGSHSSQPVAPPPDPPASAAEGRRFLTQATFGPTEAELARLTTLGSSAWLKDQLTAPRVPDTFLAYLDSRSAQLEASNAGLTTGLRHLGASQFYEQFYRRAATGPDQLRQRAAFALSQIFVVSMQDGQIAGHLRCAGSYYDLLLADAFGNYRTLLEHVTLHPAMGLYLSSLRNQKEDPSKGRLPDENYAREVMQLMSIGLYQLRQDGSVVLDAAGNPAPAYVYEDIAGLAKVFTGWSWYAPTPSNSTFWSGAGADSETNLMSPYPSYHSNSAKTFLGTSLAPASNPDPVGDLKVALDTLFNHPNVGPFLATRLIQQLVTSNPSPAYVARVAAVFADNGSKVRGDLGAVFQAVLLDREARDPALAQAPEFGKLREPVLRLCNWMRAFSATSQSGLYLLGGLDAPSSQLGQSPLNAGSVFNFWRPGYVPPHSQLAAGNLRAPEFQIVNEVSVAGYLNFIQNLIANGIGGGSGSLPPTTGSDLASGYALERPLAETPDALATRVGEALLTSPMSASLRQQIVAAVASVPMPAGATQATLDKARSNRVWLAVFLTMAAPEYLVQR